MVGTVFFVIFSFNLIYFSFGTFPIPYIRPNLCQGDEYFDSVCLKCKRCGASSKRDGQESLQQPGKGGTVCVCKPQYYQKERKGPHDIICSECPANKVPSLDSLSCLSCGEENPYNETIGSCQPCEGLVVEDGEKQICLSCKSKTVSPKQILSCSNCSSEQDPVERKCDCHSNLTLSGGHCLPVVRNKPSLFSVKYENGVSVRSAYFVEHYNAVHHNCQKHLNDTACQTLANLCVLLLYKLDSRFSADACSEFMLLAREQEKECNSSGLWLWYSDDANTVLYKNNVPNVYSTQLNTNISELQFVIIKYSVDGKILKMSLLASQELQLCSPSSLTEDIGFNFGTNIQQKCNKLIQELWDSSESAFYELYLLSNSYNSSEMYPIPILIKDLKLNNEFVNREKDKSKWQLVRRFFLTDSLSGIEAGTGLSSRSRQPLAKVFRYAKDISIVITLRKDGPTGSIFPPFMIISYGEATPDDYLKNKKVTVKFSISYEMDHSNSYSGVSIALGLLSTLAVLWSFIQTWSWFRRAGKQAIDILTLGKFLVYLCGSLATTFFIVMFCVSLNWFVMFKMQDVVHILLPTSEQENFIGTYLWIAFAMKALQVIHLLATQCNIDIFFIDWERPRPRSSSSANRPTSTSAPTKPITETVAGSSSANTSKLGTGKGTPDKINAEMAGISIWRTYFVANEWAEIQVMRKISLSLQLFGTLFFLKVVKFENLTYFTFLPSSTVQEVQGYVPYSSCCRFALGAAIYLCLAFTQVLFRKIVYERFVEDKLQQYVDLCSVSNISVFILVTKKFGYYIHGRSAHGKADVNMKEMHELLRREEEDLCGHRGLLPNTEHQTFLMGLPSGVYEQFKRLLGPLTTYTQGADRMQGVGGSLAKVDIEKVVSTYHTLNKFLAGFIEHAFKDVDYIVKDKVLLENIFDIEMYKAVDRGYFYNDTGHSFDSVLLFGNESILIIFDVLLFSVIDFTSSDYVLAAVLTYLVGKAIQSVRLSAGRRNLVRKALVDERFLT